MMHLHPLLIFFICLTAKALLTIPAHLQENVEVLVKNSHSGPLPATAVIVCDNGVESESFKLYVENELVGEWSLLWMAFMVLFAVHYVFDLRYPRKCFKTLIFVQKFICGMEDSVKAPDAVLNFQSKLL